MTTLLQLAILTAVSGSGSWQVVPGKSLGQISLGMSEDSVVQRLKQPYAQETLPDGTVMKQWISKPPSPKTRSLFYTCEFVLVYFRDTHVVQIEASSPKFTLGANLTTTNVVADFEKAYGPYKTKQEVCHHKDEGGVPAYKHYISYGDCVDQGVGWRNGWWGNMGPDQDPKLPMETILVHLPQQAVILDPDGSDDITMNQAYVKAHGYPKPFMRSPKQ